MNSICRNFMQELEGYSPRWVSHATALRIVNGMIDLLTQEVKSSLTITSGLRWFSREANKLCEDHSVSFVLKNATLHIGIVHRKQLHTLLRVDLPVGHVTPEITEEVQTGVQLEELVDPYAVETEVLLEMMQFQQAAQALSVHQSLHPQAIAQAEHVQAFMNGGVEDVRVVVPEWFYSWAIDEVLANGSDPHFSVLRPGRTELRRRMRKKIKQTPKPEDSLPFSLLVEPICLLLHRIKVSMQGEYAALVRMARVVTTGPYAAIAGEITDLLASMRQLKNKLARLNMHELDSSWSLPEDLFCAGTVAEGLPSLAYLFCEGMRAAAGETEEMVESHVLDYLRTQ